MLLLINTVNEKHDSPFPLKNQPSVLSDSHWIIRRLNAVSKQELGPVEYEIRRNP